MNTSLAGGHKPCQEIRCEKCRRLLTPARVELRYQGNTFTAELLRCPDCGQVFIPEELVKGKISEVEKILEEK